jgi:hypothetical protein
MSQEYNGYTIPELTDAADITVALQDFADSLDVKLANNTGTGDFVTFLLMGS